MKRMRRFYTLIGAIAIFYLLLFFLWPVCRVVYTSFLSFDGFSWENYRNIFTQEMYLRVLGKTLWISFVSTGIALILGYGLAYFIYCRLLKQQGIWLLMVVSSMFMSLTIRLYGWLILLGKKGPLVTLLGLPSPLFSSAAVIIGIVHFVLPFVVLNLYTTLKKIDPALEEASLMLGASQGRTFWRILFPLSLPGLFAGGSIAFSLSASTFLVPIMLGGPKEALLSNLAYTSIIDIGNLGMGAALSFVLFVFVVLVLNVLSLFERRGHHGQKMG
jgi:ABC-type spermidine/putrescine transport system permease subunit I